MKISIGACQIEITNTLPEGRQESQSIIPLYRWSVSVLDWQRQWQLHNYGLSESPEQAEAAARWCVEHINKEIDFTK